MYHQQSSCSKNGGMKIGQADYIASYQLFKTRRSIFPSSSNTMRAGAAGRPKTKKANCVRRRIDTLADRYTNDEINLEEYLEGLSFVVAKDKTKKIKK
ncbi:unnamed protein product [Didymodactylos carnosus]|uniref:Uncharacterized protein n=1 Tax=Didymodactylos carnosus TaxID=1234261 RepID=A0A813X8Q0_9BILA|nr:unnamed protein product [Didymodactylos carnosus]CAF1042416.1 unnamed protein product [Didymodactylos carnosus]CAF3655486.1 unnamed protein product [Didymodactylos carnosus]CAF3810557.1 unnamed protein product [Didymodactylos carnosus]